MRVGFVGLGNIGKPMAERLARCSPVALSVFDTRPEQVRDVVQLGAFCTASLRELAERSQLVEIVVRTAEQARDVVLGSAGLLAGLQEGSIIAIHSTVGRGVLQEMAQRCADRGVSLLDAPVSGGAQGAREGKLALMIGGDAEVLERCRPVFEVLAGAIFHLGGMGAGQAGKLANNLLYSIGMVGAHECMRLAEAAGIPEETAAAFIRASSGNNFTIQHWEHWKKHVHADSAQVSALLHKDVNLALQLAQELNVAVPLGSCVDAQIDEAVGLNVDET